MVTIETNRLSAVRDGTTLFTDVSLEIDPGACVVLTGSDPDATIALGEALTGVIPRVHQADQYSGAVHHDGESVLAASDTGFARRVGVVLPNPATQIVGLAVEDELRFAPANFEVEPSEIDRRVADVVDRLGLDGLRDADPRDLSGGETRRLTTAATLAKQPDVVLLCEPTFNVDPEGSRIIEDAIAQLCADGTTVLLTETKLDVAASVADRALVLQEGRLTHDLTADSFFAREGLLAELGLIPPPATADPSSDATASTLRPLDHNVDSTDTVPPNLSVTDLQFGYGSESVLRGVSVEVRQGEILALVGPNGSGKTTLAKQLNGLLTPDQGTIRYRGRDITAESAAELAADVGYVFQDPDTQLFATTIRDEVAFGPENLGYEDADLRVTEALETVGLGGRGSEGVGGLSRGDKQQVTIASVLAMEPSVLILDEPTAGLDYRRFWRIMANIREEFVDTETSIVLVSHDEAIVDTWADRVVALRDGQVDSVEAGVGTDREGNDTLASSERRPSGFTTERSR